MKGETQKIRVYLKNDKIYFTRFDFENLRFEIIECSTKNGDGLVLYERNRSKLIVYRDNQNEIELLIGTNTGRKWC